MKSSYKLNSYNGIFKSLCELYKPKSILEIGILDGYSLKSFVKNVPEETDIVAIDLFEIYKFRNSEKNKIEKKFKKFKNVTIIQGDFYEFYKASSNFDLIHIDISNDKDIFEFAFENYLPKTRKVLLLEGGSIERDNVEWMKKYNKNSINPFLVKNKNKYDINIIQEFPSLTVVKSKFK